MARAVLPRRADQPDLRGDERDPAHRDRARRDQAGGLLRARAALAALVLAAALVGACSEEDRRAWVRILPVVGGGEEDSLAADSLLAGFGVTPDSTAVFLDGEILFDVARLPSRGPGAAVLGTRTLTSAFLSPDGGMVAFTTRGAAPVVAVWARARQIARIAAAWPGGTAGPVSWSPDGRWLAFEGTTAGGLVEPGVFEPSAGRVLRHAVLEGLAREGRSAWVERWIEAGRLRVLVAPGRERSGGLAHVWAPTAGTFALESAIEPLAAQAPPGAALLPGGVFSADLTGDGAPETVALYRDADGAPGALVIGPEGSGGAAGPLLPPEAVGYREWKEADRGPSLYRVATLGGRPTPILAFPAPNAPGGTLLGFFQIGADGRLGPVRMESPEGGGPALFARGRGEDRALELGLIDLDGDGAPEVVTAVGRRDPLQSRMAWEARVWRWEAGRLVPGPELVPAAMREIGRLTGEPEAEPAP